MLAEAAFAPYHFMMLRDAWLCTFAPTALISASITPGTP